MKKLLPAQAFRKLASLYDDMQNQYQAHGASLGLTCEGCAQNCCTSYFQHHTRIEWAYLHHGLAELPSATRQEYERRAKAYVRDAGEALAAGERPHVMCPLNDDGLCGVYKHRLMICRLHGVPNMLRYPNGRMVDFPGCYRSQELCEKAEHVPVLGRTPLYTRLMELEVQYVGPTKVRSLPRVDLTLAEMIVLGAPQF